MAKARERLVNKDKFNPDALRASLAAKGVKLPSWMDRPMITPALTKETSYDDLKKHHNDHLEYVGDFENGSIGDQFVRSVYESDPEKYIEDSPRGEKYRKKVNIKASSIEYGKNPEKALARAQKSFASRGSKSLSAG